MSQERDQAIDKVLAAARTDPPNLEDLTRALDEYAIVKVREDYQAQQDQAQVSTNADEPQP